jgi:hypothetical protein
MKSHRLAIYIAVFAAQMVILGFASTVPMNQSQAESLVQSIQGIQPTQVGIFENNVRVSLLEIIPGFGPVFGGLVTYDTGLVISATGQVPNATTTGLEALLFLIVTPIFWLEFFCYSLSIEESISIIVSLRNRTFRVLEWKWLLGTIATVIVVLFVSAGIEVQLIHFMG